MTNADPTPFADLTRSINIRENERGARLGNGRDPQHHRPIDLYSTYSDDFRLGLNAAGTTLCAIAKLAGAKQSGGK